MTATNHGFVQQHEQEALEGTLCQSIDAYLTRTYGPKRARLGPGLRWLQGHDGTCACLDHAEYRIKDGLKTIVSRPYQLYLAQVEQAITIAKNKGLRLWITAPSNYNLDTILVIFTQQGA